jgi:FixJ family two-component response regulator
VAETLALSLRMSGYPAIGFTRPAEALSAIREKDVLATDYHLPEMTWLELAQRAYAQGWRGSLFIMSGHSKVIDHPLLHFILNRK